MNVSTQLRLLNKTQTQTQTPTQTPTRPIRARVNPSRRPASRRAAHWDGRWRIDERTREIGRAGIASARAALAAAHADELDDLRRAS